MEGVLMETSGNGERHGKRTFSHNLSDGSHVFILRVMWSAYESRYYNIESKWQRAEFLQCFLQSVRFLIIYSFMISTV
jgi:hypothetical protein